MYNILKILGDESTGGSGSALGAPVPAGTGNNTTGIKTVGGDTDLMGNIVSIINGVIGVLGVVCVVVMIVGGVNYMTSTGESAKVEKAKKTILYGLIGLVVCVLAFAIVNFVISNIIGGADWGN